MKLFFIYGPPAVGKLTVANELAKITGFPVFHNHLTRDIVHELYPHTLSEHYDLVHDLRLTVFHYLASHGTSAIFTYVYDGESDWPTVKQMIQSVEPSGGEVCFVELTTDRGTLLNRVTEDSRKTHKKIHSAETLAEVIDVNSFSSVPLSNILVIDNTNVSAHDTAVQIATHYGVI
jgi:hypothetical protein